MKQYTGSMLHGVNKQKVAPGLLGEVVSLELGLIPEEEIKNNICPLVEQLESIFSKYDVHLWVSSGYHEDKE